MKQNGHVPVDKYEKVQYTPLETVIQIEEGSRRFYIQTFFQILKSAIPYLIFLTMYGLNSKLHILATPQDLGKIHLFNISHLEYSIIRFYPHKVISSHHHIILDFLAALPYLLHYILPVVYPLYLLCKSRPEDVCRFYWLLGWFLWVQYIIWYLLPTAPPWFYDNLKEYEEIGETPPLKEQHKEGCAFSRVDQKTGVPFFFKMFGNNPVPYGAFPSGHVAWPTTICTVSPPFGPFCWLYVLYVAWATLYSCHHYLSDALCAVGLVLIVKKVIMYIKQRQCNGILNKTRNFWCPFSPE